jgi:hypothetical protein
MIEQKYTRVFHTEHRPVETGVVFEDEGMAAVFVKEGDATVVRPSTGVAGEIFAGISLSRNVPPMFVPHVIEGKLRGVVSVQLPRVPLAGQILVKLDGVKLAIKAAAPASVAEVQLVADTLNFHADADGKDLFVQFMYEPTISEARMFKGDVAIGGLSSAAQGIIGLITLGDVATTYFDASADWSGALQANLGPNGIFTVGGAGAVVGTVMGAPSSSNPKLVISITKS